MMWQRAGVGPGAPDRQPASDRLESSRAGAVRRSRLWTIGALAFVVASLVYLFVSIEDPNPERHLFFGRWRPAELLATGAAWWLAALLFSRARSREATRRLVAMSAAALVAWVLLELPALAGLVDYQALLGGDPRMRLSTERVPHADVAGVTYQDTALTWGIDSEPIAFRFRTDRYGLRNEPDRETAEIYLLGDSFLVAGLLPFDQTIASRLESLTGRPTMSVALSGLSVDGERRLLESLGLTLDGRLVLQFVYEGNDLSDLAEAVQPSVFVRSLRFIDRNLWGVPRGDQRSLWSRSLTGNVLVVLGSLARGTRPLARRRSGEIAGRSFTFLYAGEAMRAHDGRIPAVLDVLLDTRRRVEAAGGAYGVVVIPSKLRVLGPLCRWPEGSDLVDYAAQLSRLPEALAQWGRQTGTPVVDLSGPLAEAAASGRIPWFQGDTHWNATGHRVGAQVVAAAPVVTQWLARGGPNRAP